MSVSGIHAALERVVQRLASDPKVQRETKAAFLDLLEQVVNERDSARVPPASRTPAGSMAFLTGTPMYAANTYATTGGPSAMSSSLVRNSTLPVLAQLPDELGAGDGQYNTREAMFRERLDIAAIEQRLRSSAQSYGLEYHEEDLNGILRNAGYDAAHMGSSERYIAAVQTFLGYAEDTYKERANNVPGTNA
jgi:hypothetical protein